MPLILIHMYHGCSSQETVDLNIVWIHICIHRANTWIVLWGFPEFY